MSPEAAIEIMRSLITTSLIVVSPIVGVTIVIGVIVSLVQAVTSIQEQTLTFVPKLIGVGLLMILTAPWLLRQLMQFTITFLTKLPEMAR
jgi:flagellar biosynthesis protein FliQ